MNGVVLVADLLRSQTLLSGLVLRGRSVLVCAAHEQQVPAAQATVSFEGEANRVSAVKQRKGEDGGQAVEVRLAKANKQVEICFQR